MNRQDRQGARTPADLERKYGLRDLGKSFAEVMGIATDARFMAEELAKELEENIRRVETEIAEMEDRIVLSVSETYATNEYVNSKIEMQSDSILLSVSKTYATNEYVNSQIAMQSDSILLSVSETYATNKSVDSKLEMQSDSILLSVSERYATNEYVNSKIETQSDSILLSVSKTYATNEYVNSQIAMQSDSILLSVSDTYATNEYAKAQLDLKVGVDEYDRIVSMINLSSNDINITANRLTISSDKFSLAKDGTVSMRFSEDDAEDEYLLNTETHYLKLPDFEVFKSKSNGTHTKIKSARIGTALFDTSDIYLSAQVYFSDDGIVLPTKNANLTNNIGCFVWENNDGTKLFRMRACDNGDEGFAILLEGLEHENERLDFKAFGISLRNILNRLKTVEAKVDITEPEQCVHSIVVERQELNASCTERGEIGVYCKDCGALVGVKYIDPLGHDYDDWGECTRCGEIDPGYEGGGLGGVCEHGVVGEVLYDSIGEPYGYKCGLCDETIYN